MPRWLVTIMLVVAAGFLALALALGSGKGKGKAAPQEPAPTTPQAAEGSSTPTTAKPQAAESVEPVKVEGLHTAVVDTQPEPIIGSAAAGKENVFPMEVKFSPWGAGIIHAKLSGYSTDVVLNKEGFTPYPVQERLIYEYPTGGSATYRYPMAAESITVNGQKLLLRNERWEVVADQTNDRTAVFRLTLRDGQEKDVLRITRVWRLEPRAPDGPVRYDLRLEQSIENLTSGALVVRFAQFGPMDMAKEVGYVGDQRHVILGYLQPRRTGDEKYLTTDEFDLPRTKVLDEDMPARLWPAHGDDERRDVMWVALTNRYFTAAVHAPLDPSRPLAHAVEEVFPFVTRVAWPGKGKDQYLAVLMETGEVTMAPGASQRLDVALYAGPKSRKVLEDDPAYAALGLGQIIVYNLGGCCANCTFAWLANGLFAFMGLIESLLRDWGIAIVVPVAVVRTLLHPLTKGSQVNMMKLSKQMGTLQPELDKLKLKHKDNPTKLNQEMMALYREKGVNPAAMGLGCLPMFLQMPIWVALYAMLYFAIELRHEPAFWGVFQKISGGSWPFMADLSSPDNFIPLPAAMHFTVPLIGQTLTAINILPILMGIVFFLQQKYMTPPNPNMSPEMRSQQAMMKWMTVILFPIMLFWSPSGLTLYILTSTSVGIVESKRVRKHIKELEESGRLHEKKQRKPGGFMDRLMKMAEARQKAMEEQAKLDQRSGKKKNR